MRASDAQPIGAGIISAITGFASSFVLVIAGLKAVGASDADAASGLLALCILQAVIAIVLGLRYRMPLAFAWSTPGAALLVAATAITDDYRTAVGAFMVCGVLLLITGLWPALARAMTRIPKAIASAMLAGILFPICLAPVTAAVSLPHLALPMIGVWLVLSRFAPRWAVPGAVAAAIAGVAVAGVDAELSPAQLLPVVTFTLPAFDPLVIASLGVPLYIVTMAGQNVPGFAVLHMFGYPHPPARAILTATGGATVLGAAVGGYTLNLAAITAAMVAGPEAHPDKDRRWVASVTGGVAYLVLGLAAGAATTLVAVSPKELITAVAGLALFGAFATATAGALEEPSTRPTAVVTFLVVASGVSLAGIGSAFWGLVVGAIVMVVQTWRPRPRPQRVSDPDAATTASGTL